MTNIIGTIGIVLSTNWATIQSDKPVCHDPKCKEVHYETLLQVGTVTTNIVLNMTWKNQSKEFVLETMEPGYITRIGKVPVSVTNVPLLITKPKK